MKKIRFRWFFVFLTFFCSISLFGQTTYTWIGANNASWAVSTNWSPTRTTPAANNILQFNDGTTKTITAVPTQTVGLFVMSGNTNITLQSSSAQTLTIGNGAGTDLVIPTGSALTLGTNTNVTLAASAAADISGTLTINSGRTYNTNGTSVVTTVNGSIVNSGTITNTTAAKLIFSGGSTYIHNNSGSVSAIPTASWNANSTCVIQAIKQDATMNLGQSFGNFIWNSSTQSDDVYLPSGFSVQNDFALQANASGKIIYFNDATTVRTINIGGDFIIQAGDIVLTKDIGTLTLNIGGNLTISGGTINLGESASSTLNINGNFSQTAGTIYRSNSSSNSQFNFNSDDGTFNRTGGTFTNAYVNFVVNSGKKLTLLSNLNVAVSRSLTTNGTLFCGVNNIVGAGAFTLPSGGTLGIGSTAGITTSGAAGNIQVTGTRTFNTGANYIYNGSAAQVTGNGLPTSAITGSLTIENTSGVTPTNNINMSGTLTVNGLLTPTATRVISGGGTLTGTGTVRVTRIAATADFSSQYTITNKTLTNLTVEYAGAADQIISALTYGSLRVNNSSGFTLGGNVTVNGAFTFTNGLITLGINNITLGSSATIVGTPSATAMVVATSSGELRKIFTGTGSFTLPVGDNTGTADYSPVTLDFTSGTFSSAYASFRLVNSKHPDNNSSNDYINRYWTVSSSGISNFTCVATFSYVHADIVGIEDNLYCGKWDGGGWTLLNAANTTNNHLSGIVTSFSDFTGGEQSALPVELSSFTARILKNGDIQLNWRTETEVSNFGFEIERASSLTTPVQEWRKIGFVQGHGNSNSPKDYSFLDNVISGKYSYRLKQIDTDGQFEYSKVIEVDLGSPTKFELSQNYPNPFNPITTIKFNLPDPRTVKLSVFDVLGQEVETLVNGLREAGTHTILFNAAELNSGLYIYKLEMSGNSEVRKMLLVK